MSEKRDAAHKDPLGLQGIFDADAERKRKKHLEQKKFTVKEYLEMVAKDPLLAQNAPSRLLEAIEAKGVQEIPEKRRLLLSTTDFPPIRYNAFDKLFGLEVPILRFMQFLKAGKNRLSTGKQILLLVGPTASAKSTFANTIKHLLEDYHLRPVFKITGCKMQEDPLHLIPRYLRKWTSVKLADCKECQNALRADKPLPPEHLHLGVSIDGDLCPQCRNNLNMPAAKGGKYVDEDGTLRWWDYPVETFTFSINGARGIGSFEPSDENTQNIGDLVGKENIQISSLRGPDDPESYALCGELEKGNRGTVEGRELIKAKVEFLRAFISVAEEKEFKLQGSSLPHISVDTVILGHTNLVEFKKFNSNQANEALHDRIFVIAFPYTVEINQELAIYQKLIKEESDFNNISDCHISPGSLELAALFAVITRLEESNLGVSLLDKAKILNGDRALTELQDKDKNPVDVRELIREGNKHAEDITKNDGMHGVSSRDVLAAINTKLVQNEGGCLTPMKVLRSLRDVFQHRMGYEPENLQRFQELLSDKDGIVYKEYRTFILKAVKKAFLGGPTKDFVGKLYTDYRKAVGLDRSNQRRFIRTNTPAPVDDLGTKIEADYRLMESIERHFSPQMDEEAVKQFRGEFLEYHAVTEEPYPMVLQACEEKVLKDSADNLMVVLSDDQAPTEEQTKLAKYMYQELENSGFCQICSIEATKNARKFIREE